jgi:hypothetical protein
MSSWIKHHTQPKRVFRNINNIDKNTTNQVSPPTIYNNSYTPYLFDYDKGRRVSNIIKEFCLMKLGNVKKIVNVYKPFYKNNIPAAGLGDYIRGSIFLYQYCKLGNIAFDMNMNYHGIDIILNNIHYPIKDYYLENIEHSSILNYHPEVVNKNDINIYIEVINSVNLYLSNCMVDENGVLYSCMKTYPIFQLTSDDRIFIKNCLKYNKILENELNNKQNLYNLIGNNYNIIHIRSGDKYLIDNNTITNNIISKLKSAIGYYIKNNTNKQIILIGDSNNILNILVQQYPQLINFNNNISHMGEGVNCTYDNIINNMIEFYIMAESSSIFSISSYNHGSGFSKWCAEINNIQYTGIHIS